MGKRTSDRFYQNENADVAANLRRDLEEVRSRLLSNTERLGNHSDDMNTRVQEIELGMEEMLDKIWELDKSWKNNLVFYGVKSEEGSQMPHDKKRSRNL